MKLVAATLVPTGPGRTALTPDDLYDLLMQLRFESDRIEHIKVFTQADQLCIGAYISATDGDEAQECLSRLCQRLVGVISGWAIVAGG